jgi:hypothetical protein
MATRRKLLKYVAAAALAAKLAALREALARAELQKGIHRVRGDARLNGAPAKERMDVRAGDAVSTGADGELVFVIARDAMLVRAHSRVEIEGTSGALVASGLRILTGAVLSVFVTGEPKRVITPTATIGIRGTALYVEAVPERTYACTCYGIAELQALHDPASRETVQTTKHEQPRYILGPGAAQSVVRAPVINHTDAELIFLEGLVGREPPFYNWFEKYNTGY